MFAQLLFVLYTHVHTYVYATKLNYIRTYECTYTYSYMWPDLTKAGLDAHIKQIHFPPPIDRSIHGLTIDGYFTVHSSSVCFPRGLFLWPVWRPRVYGCSSNGPGASWQVANWLKTSSKVESILMSGIDLATFWRDYSWKWPQERPIKPFMWLVSFFCNAVTRPPPLTRLPCTGTFVI